MPAPERSPAKEMSRALDFLLLKPFVFPKEHVASIRQGGRVDRGSLCLGADNAPSLVVT